MKWETIYKISWFVFAVMFTLLAIIYYDKIDSDKIEEFEMPEPAMSSENYNIHLCISGLVTDPNCYNFVASGYIISLNKAIKNINRTTRNANRLTFFGYSITAIASWITLISLLIFKKNRK